LSLKHDFVSKVKDGFTGQLAESNLNDVAQW